MIIKFSLNKEYWDGIFLWLYILTLRYRNIIENKKVSIPIIILGRNTKDDHQLEWINKEFISELKTTD